MVNYRKQSSSYSSLTSEQSGWAYEDSFGSTSSNAGYVCTHGCSTYREMECSMTGMALATTEHKGVTTDAVMETTSVGVLGAMDATQGPIDVLI